MAFFLSSSLKTGRLIFRSPPCSLQHWPWYIHLEPPDLLDHDDTDEEVDTELLSLSNPLSSEGEGVRVSSAHSSHCIWLQSWQHCDTQSWSWCYIWWVCLGSSTHLSVLWSLSSCWGPSWLQNLNGSNAGRCERGCPGPLVSTHHSVMAWAINHWPSHRFNALALSWACLPTQLMALIV